MAMDLSELDVIDDDIVEDAPQQPQQTEQVSETEIPIDEDEIPQNEEEEVVEEDPKESEDAIFSFLKSKGIDDYTKIKFENEDGTIEEVSWNDLSEEEKLNILNTDDEKDDDEDLDDSEIDFINRVRLSGMSIEDYVQSIKNQGANEYAQSIQNQDTQEQYNYTVDDLTDEELYVLDLQARIEDISDEECREALDRAMSNESLFKKEVAGLREDYKRMEDERNNREIALQQQQQQEQFQAFSNNVINGINSFTNIGELDVNMDDDDKNQLYQFLTGVDSAGVNYFAKALNDPETMVKTAWFALHGEEVINNISQYYKQQIQEVAKANYEKGKNDAKPKKTTERKVVVQKQPKKENINIKSINDLD